MSDYLLLTNHFECPACRRPHNITHGYGECRKCGEMLFNHIHQWEKYAEETGWRELWVFTKENGWMHYTQLTMRTEAQSRSIKVNTTPIETKEERIAKVRAETKAKQRWYLSQKKKIRSFGK